MYEDLLLPPGARLVHIGPPKTGTTAIQQAFATVGDGLHEHGAHYAAGGESRPRAAVAGLLRSATEPGDAWRELAREVSSAGDWRVCVSNEMLARCDDARAARVAAELGDEHTHVVMTARPMEKLLASQWQQRVRKQARMVSYDDWLRIVLADRADDPHHRHFWGLHDLAAQIERWSVATGSDRVVVAVSDETDRGFLPRIFEGLLGLPEGLLVPPPNLSNRSLDHFEAELLRALDKVAYEAGWDRRRYLNEVKPAMSVYLRRRVREQSDPIALPEWAVDRVVDLDQQRIRLLQHASVTVVGDPERLRRQPTTGGAAATYDGWVPVTSAARFTAAVVETMQRRERSMHRRLRRTEASTAQHNARSIDEAGGRELARALLGRAARFLRR